jgi:hypothetical protein
MAVKQVRIGDGGRVATRQKFWRKNVKMDIKTSFCKVMSEVKKDLEDAYAGICQIKNNTLYKNFVRNSTSKLARSTFTSPGWIRVKGTVSLDYVCLEEVPVQPSTLMKKFRRLNRSCTGLSRRNPASLGLVNGLKWWMSGFRRRR